jgi:predicted nuclease of restriction endonuclease-like RecB superfamily
MENQLIGLSIADLVPEIPTTLAWLSIAQIHHLRHLLIAQTQKIVQVLNPDWESEQISGC